MIKEYNYNRFLIILDSVQMRQSELVYKNDILQDSYYIRNYTSNSEVSFVQNMYMAL